MKADRRKIEIIMARELGVDVTDIHWKNILKHLFHTKRHLSVFLLNI